MKSSKERKMNRKANHKALSVEKTEASRQRRLDNKAKRDEIHAIDPDIKVRVVNQVTYDDLGTEIMIENGKIKTVEPEILVAADEDEVNVMVEPTVEISTVKKDFYTEYMVPVEAETVEVDDVSKFQKLVNKWRK